MVSEENRIGLYVALPIYFSVFFLMGLLGWRTKRRRAQQNADTDEMVSHFVAGKSLGTFVTMMTIFASLFSGYTMVGVPNEAFANGFTALRWIPSKLFMCFGYMGTAPRLRRASLVRHYHSPLDFITDRFRSQILRYIILIVLLVPSVIYLAAQPITLQGNFNDLFDLDPDNPVAPIVVSVFILVLEWIGGLNVVAYTDAIQGILMVIAFVMMSCTLAALYGGFAGEEFNPIKYPRPDFFQVPSTESQLSMWTFSFQWISFLALPHFQQRTYASGDFKSIRLAFFVIAVAPWLTMMVGVYSGTLGVSLLSDEETVDNPFTAIIGKLMDASGFGYFAGLLVLVGSIAAIISTADSLLIAISHMIMSEVMMVIYPKASTAKIAFMGKIISLIVMCLALLIALTDDGALSDLASVQNGMLLQAVPAFVIGLYFSPRFIPHPYVIAFGAMVGFITVVTTYYAYNQDEDNYEFNSGIWGLCLQTALMAIIEPIVRYRKCGCMSARPKWDTPGNLSHFGEQPISYEWLSKLMRNVKEPLQSKWYVGLIVVTSILLLPGNSAGLPELGEQADDGTYPDFAPTTVGGLPDWAFKLLMASVIITFALVYAIYELPSDLDNLDDMNDDTDHKGHTLKLTETDVSASKTSAVDAPTSTTVDATPSAVRVVADA